MPLWWTVLGAVSVALALSAAVALWILAVTIRPLGTSIYRYAMSEMVRTPYPMNILSMWNLLQRANPQVFIENILRTRSTEPIERPMGGPNILSPWDKLVFSPAQVSKLATPTDAPIDMRVVIGPRSEKPLQCDIPILITGMSFAGALSEAAKVALARGATAAGTATNTGENYLPAEREHAKRLIVQYHRGDWPRAAQHHPEWLERADAIEVQVGQGAQASSTRRTKASKIGSEMRDAMGLKPGEDAVIRSRFSGVEEPGDLVARVRELRERYRVPVGVKLVPSARLMEDLDLLMDAEPDFLVLDGGEGGTHGGPPILQDDFGLPLMVGLRWTEEYLKDRRLRHQVSVIAAGGLRTPGHFLKAMALGADAVYIGFAALMAMAAAESPKVMPWAPPEALFYGRGPSRTKLNVDRAATALERFLKSSAAEMTFGVEALGFTRVRDVSAGDLVALDPWTARLAGVRSLVNEGPTWSEWDRPPEKPSEQHPPH
jgi:glutamate synthase domain-containing protein 2